MTTVPAPPWSAETTLMLSCVRRTLGLAEDVHSREDRPDVDGDLLVQAALGHGVMPHVHVGLRDPGPVAIPAATRASLAAHYRANARRNLVRTGELLALLADLEAQGIQAIPLKGPVLAMALYGTVAMRQFTDMDVIVPLPHVARARSVLEARGYHTRPSGETSIAAVKGSGDEAAMVDLQWALADEQYRFPIALDRLWQRAERVPFMNTAVWQPAADDHLVILCGHAAKHSWSRLGWVTDIGAFVQAHGHRLDWRDALAAARRTGAERLVLLGLALARDALGVPLPGDVQSRLRGATLVERLTTELHQNLFSAAGAPARLNGSYGFVEAGLLYMRSRERLRDKLPYGRYLLRVLRQWWTIVPNAQDRAVLALPPWLGFLYFAIRPLRLLNKYGLRLLKCSARAGVAWR